MTFFRSLFLLLALAGLAGILVYFARPQWFATAGDKAAPHPVEVRTATLLLPAGGKTPTSPDGADVRRLVEMEDEGLPSRVIPYLMVVNTSDQSVRHYRLSPKVRAITLRGENPDVKVKQSKVLNSKGPYQLEIWLPADRDLTVDVEYEFPR